MSMKFGICVASHINDIDYIVKAEELGFHSAWLADSQMLWSDCYATLALAATRTRRIHLGTGVAVTGTRPPAVTASSIATINALAPKRTFLGVGSGNTAMRVMGMPPHRIAEFDRYLHELRPLLQGEESLTRFNKQEIPIKHIMPNDGFVNFNDPIHLYISGFGPKSLAVAGKHGDGAVLAMPANANIMANIWRMLESSDEPNTRIHDRSRFLTTALTAIVVLDPGEPVDSPRVKSECGAMAMAAIHFGYEQVRNFGKKPGGALAYVWDDYRQMIESYPKERRHQRIHAGHNCWVVPEEEKFLTPDVLRASSLIGTRDQIIDQLGQLYEAGLHQVMILPNFATRYQSIERLAKDILGNVYQR